MSIQDGTVTWEKRKIANTDNLSMPTTTGTIEITTTTASPQNFTAPADGYYFFSGKNRTGARQRVTLSTANTYFATDDNCENGDSIYIFVPISKGQQCRLSVQPADSFSNITDVAFRFIPAKSAV